MRKFTKLIVTSIFMVMAISGKADELAVRVKEVIHEHDVMTSHLTISTEYDRQVTKMEYHGVVQSVQYNKSHSICAINFKPGTQVNEVYIAILIRAGGVKLIKDFNDMVGKNFNYHGEQLPNTDYIYVDRISGNILEVSCGTKGEPNYWLKVEISSAGDVGIVPGSIHKAN